MKKKSQLEKTFKKKFLADLEEEYGPACRITHNDPQQCQGIPDATMNCCFDDGTIFWTDLEFKREKGSPKQPNQEHYVKLNGFFVNPENSNEVRDEIRHAISKARGRSCVP